MKTKAEKTIAKANREAIYAAITKNPLFDVANITSPRIAREAIRQLNKLCLSLPNSKKLLTLFKQIDNAGDHIYHEVFTAEERAADDIHKKVSHVFNHSDMHRASYKKRILAA